MKRNGWLAILALSACSSNVDVPTTDAEACAEVPACMTPELPAEGPTAAIWRVLLERDEAGVRIARFEEIETSAADGRPLSPTDGSHALVALDGAGELLESRLVAFPDEERVSEVPFGGHQSVPGPVAASTVGFLAVNAQVVTVALVLPDGTVTASIDAPAPGEAIRIEEGGSSALSQPAPGTHCAHVMLIEGPEDQAWAPWEVQRVTPMQKAIVRATLGRLTAELCAGVSRIGFRELPSTTGGRVSSIYGDFVSINSALDIDGLGFDDRSLVTPRAQALLQRALTHEIAHTTTRLLEASRSNRWFESEWSPTQWSEGGRAVDHVRLGGGSLPQRWLAMHESFVSQGWASAYYGDDEAEAERVKSLGTDGIVTLGAMSSYSASEPHEDIAEFAMWAIMSPVYQDLGIRLGPRDLRNDHACVAMSGYGDADVPSGLSAVYTKLGFIRDLGWITDDLYDRCTGPNTGLPRDREGIEVWQDGELRRVFWESPRAGIGTLDDNYVFTMDVSGRAEFGGEEYPATFSMRVQLRPTTSAEGPVPVDDVSWPRGVYPITPFGAHVMQLRIPDAPAGNFDVTNGFILFAGATNDEIVGSVVVREAFRNQAPIPVPQVFDPNLQLRFLLRSE